jgi:hypothetical protein
MATTAFCYSAKQELAQAGHCFNATNSTMTGNIGGSANSYLYGLTNTVNLAVGMSVITTNSVSSGLVNNAVISRIINSTAVKLDAFGSGAATNAGTITFTADTFYMSLITGTPVRTFDGTQTNAGTPGTGVASATNIGTDEVSGTGYTANGFALTNISPAVGTTAAFWSFTTNPSWTSATLNASAAVIYNYSTAPRLGHGNGITPSASGSAVNRTISVHDFGGKQQVTSGTFTVVLPTNAQGTAILQIS